MCHFKEQGLGLHRRSPRQRHTQVCISERAPRLQLDSGHGRECSQEAAEWTKLSLPDLILLQLFFHQQPLWLHHFHSVWAQAAQFSPVAQSCLTLCDRIDCSRPGFPGHHQLLELTQTHVIESVMPSSHLILYCPLLLPPSIFPSIRVFSNESVLHIRWPKGWSFSFSISPSNEYSGLISFKTGNSTSYK